MSIGGRNENVFASIVFQILITANLSQQKKTQGENDAKEEENSEVNILNVRRGS